MLKDFLKKHERSLSFAAFFTGFTIDNFTLTRIDLLLDNVILASYLAVGAIGIFMYQAVNRRLVKSDRTATILSLLTLLIQFAFGGLFSGFFVFYSRSASLVTSWWFVLLIVFLLLGNEFFKEKYARLEYQVSVYFVTIFSFAIFFVPIVVNKMGAWIFILSGLVSLFVIYLFVRALERIAPDAVAHTKDTLKKSIFTIYVIFNILYFTNIIPPIPLSLKDASIHHSVKRVGDSYIAQSEVVKWYELGKKLRPRIHINADSSVSVYTSVFAPTDINVDIYHSWQYYDEAERKWTESDRVFYPISGGRGEGYRGYTKKNSTFEGKWRVDIITNREQIIGRLKFRIINDGSTPTIVREVIE